MRQYEDGLWWMKMSHHDRKGSWDAVKDNKSTSGFSGTGDNIHYAISRLVRNLGLETQSTREYLNRAVTNAHLVPANLLLWS